MTKLDLAWAAGFIDGEGCIRINKKISKDNNSTRYTVNISCGQTTLNPLNKLKNLFGGSVFGVDRTENEYNKNWAKRYDWSVSSDKALNALILILPFLVVKKEEAEMILKYRFQSTPKSRGFKVPKTELNKREKLYRQLKKLKIKNKSYPHRKVA